MVEFGAAAIGLLNAVGGLTAALLFAGEQTGGLIRAWDGGYRAFEGCKGPYRRPPVCWRKRDLIYQIKFVMPLVFS